MLVKRLVVGSQSLQIVLRGGGGGGEGGVKGRFVQIMLVNRNHWITVSNLQCPGNTIYIYDSMFSTVDNRTKEKICSIWRPAASYVHYRMVNIQLQTNSYDCGLFAIAVATELAYNRDPQW